MSDVIIVILFSTVKFAISVPLAIIEYNFSALQTIIITSIGGILGVFVFAFFTEFLIDVWKAIVRIFPKLRKKNKTNVFSKKSRKIVKLKSNYGLVGLSLITPILLSIPIGTFIVFRYYKRTVKVFLFLISFVVLWSVVLTIISIFFKSYIEHLFF